MEFRGLARLQVYRTGPPAWPLLNLVIGFLISLRLDFGCGVPWKVGGQLSLDDFELRVASKIFEFLLIRSVIVEFFAAITVPDVSPMF